MKTRRIYLQQLACTVFLLSFFISCNKDEPDLQDPPPTDPPANLVRPNAGNTGYTPGTTLRTWSGPDWDGRADLVIEGYDLTPVAKSYFTFAGNNVTIRNCRINAGLLMGGDNVKVERCEIIGGISLSGTATGSIQYNNIHHIGDDGIHITSDNGRVSNITVAHNFVHTFTPVCGAHADGMQVRGVDGLTVFNNAIDLGAWRQVCGLNTLNAAIFVENANGGNKNVTIDRNYLNGGGFLFDISTCPNTRIIKNRLGRDERFGVATVSAPAADIVDKTGNVRDDNNAPVSF